MAVIPKYDDSSIRTMSALEHIRAKSGMYIGEGGVHADFSLIKELVDNATDEALDKNQVYHIVIKFFTNGTKYQFCIIDNARGIPVNKLKSVYTETNTSGKFDKAYNAVSTGTYGVGSKTNSALSAIFLAMTNRPEGFGGLKLEDAKVIDYSILAARNEPTGTTVLYEPDPRFLSDTTKFMSHPEGLEKTIQLLEYASVFRPNVKFTVYRINKLLSKNWFNKPYEEMWDYLHKVTGEVIYASPDNLDPFEYSKNKFEILEKTVWRFDAKKEIDLTEDYDTIGFNISIGLTDNPERHQGVLGCVNYNVINTWRASHMASVQNAFKNKLIQYLDEDDNDLRAFFINTYIIPFHGFIVGFGKNLDFVNQTKDSFVNSQWAKEYTFHLNKILDKQPDGLFENLFELIQTDLMTKFARATNKNLNTGKSLKNVAFELRRSDSYFSCETKDKNQAILHIVEGLSSGNWVTQLRDPSYQAVYELRGKCLNTFTSSQDQCRKDEVFADLVRLIGVHPRDTNLDNMNFKEICIMADADPDGLSIIDLLIGMFYTINPLILEQGRVTIAMPPLYVLASKDKTMFLRDQHALDDIMVSIYETHLKIGVSINGGKINNLKGDAYRDVVYLIKHICAIIESVSRKLAIDPFIVEQMCHCVDYIYPGHVNTLAIKHTLGLDDCVYSPVSNVITLIQDKTEISVPIDRLMNEIKIYILPELKNINWEALTFFVTTKDTSYYRDTPVMFWQLRQIFDIFDKEFNIRRIKGLGECTAEELKYTCLDPTTRTVVTIKGIGDVKTLFDMLGVDTTERKKLVSSDMDSEWQRGAL